MNGPIQRWMARRHGRSIRTDKTRACRSKAATSVEKYTLRFSGFFGSILRGPPLVTGVKRCPRRYVVPPSLLRDRLTPLPPVVGPVWVWQEPNPFYKRVCLAICARRSRSGLRYENEPKWLFLIRPPTPARRVAVSPFGRVRTGDFQSFFFLLQRLPQRNARLRARFLKKTLALALAWCYVGTRAP